MILDSARSCSEVDRAPCFIEGKLVTPSRLFHISGSQQHKLCFCVLRTYCPVTMTEWPTAGYKVSMFGAVKCVHDEKCSLRRGARRNVFFGYSFATLAFSSTSPACYYKTGLVCTSILRRQPRPFYSSRISCFGFRRGSYAIIPQLCTNILFHQNQMKNYVTRRRRINMHISSHVITCLIIMS